MVWFRRLGRLVYIFSFYLLNIDWIQCKQTACEFNKLCFCSNYTRQLAELTCVGVHIRLKELPHNYFYRIRIIGARDLAVIENNDFLNIKSLSSLTVSRSRLSSVDSLAFAHSGVEQTLTTLELSHSELREFPSSALLHLPRLQWLSLRANKIEDIKAKDFKALLLRSLLLSDNSLSVVLDRTFTELSNLEFLDLDDNLITRVEGTPFPSSLKTLSLSNCLLQEVPFDSMANLPNIQILQFRGNLIRHLPHIQLPTDNLQMLDLSHNLISSISGDVFTFGAELQNPYNPLKQERKGSEQTHRRALKYRFAKNENISHTNEKTLRIRDLHLDFNFIQSLPDGVFAHISCQRLSLSNNRITSPFISKLALDGPMEEELKALDLNYNLIDTYPHALKTLKNIRQILLKNNRIEYIDSNAFSNCAQSLEVLDLSKNLLSEMPSSALSVTKSLIRLSLSDNSIARLDDNDLGDWAQTLLSLSLSKNSLKAISGDAFRRANNLRELRLAGNNILHASPDLLVPLRSLELLDLSYAFNYVNSGHILQTVAIESLASLKWLQLDYNRLDFTPFSVEFKAFKALMHCDLENNGINEISSEFSANLNLSSIILSRNQLSTIKADTFAQLPQVENIALYLNKIKTIEKNAFKSLPKLKTIILSKNFISSIALEAFYNLSVSSASLSILLDENRLKCFSADIFGAMTLSQNSLKGFLYINVSHNEIRRLDACAAAEPPEQSNSPERIYINNNNKSVSGDHQSIQTLNVRVLDLSFNSIEHIPNPFLDTMCKSLHSLHLNNNKLKAFPLSVLQLCPELQILILNNNLITETLSYTNETFVSDIQVLGLKQNRINSIIEFIPVFKQLTNLRILDLSHNFITRLPDNCFAGTSIARLQISNNNLSNIKINRQISLNSDNKCFGVKSSLKYFDLSHNYFSSVPIEVMSCENLIELSLTNNLIEELAVRSTTKFISLLQIDLSHNAIKNIDNNSFLFGAQNLNTLKLNNISLTTLPILNLPHLTHLELAENYLSLIDPKALTTSRSIRYLDLSKNSIQDVPRYLWKYMTKLQTLSLRYNPIDILDTSSFSDLKHLNHLDIRGLSLQYIDTRLLHSHRYLLSLKSSTYPNVRSFRLHDILAKTSSLRSALIEVQETTLSHQIQWAFGTKLKELIITGSNLIKILPDAFLGLYNTYDLTLRVTNTNISSLPSGLLRYLADIRFITIDLRKNKLKSLKPDVFLVRSTNKVSKNWESQQILGGILLDENGLKCDCDLIAISDWLKRLISDMKAVMSREAVIQANSMASMSQCISPVMSEVPVERESVSNESVPHNQRIKRISLLDLRSEDIFCENISIKLTSDSVLIIILLIVRTNRLCSLSEII